MGLTNLGDHRRIQVLYWMHRARRDLVLQTPFSTLRTTGTFALRSPVRPNPIASSIVEPRSSSWWQSTVRPSRCVGSTASTARRLSI
jgi:tRNA (Thr-GGU) A37 N-methylase